MRPPLPIAAALCALVLFLGLVAVVAAADRHPSSSGGHLSSIPDGRSRTTPATPGAQPRRRTGPVPKLPGGRTRIFDHRFLVAYYGTPQTTRLGVLGVGSPRQVTERLRDAAQPFHRKGQEPQLVYELIATVVDGGPGEGGDYSHEIPKEYVEEYIQAAHRNKALLLIDVQPGRSDFLRISKRWAWR